MHIIIDISEEMYKASKILDARYEYTVQIPLEVIANGTPLPKGHGRILDEKNILDTGNNDGGWYDLVDMPEYIAGVKAIIEAEKEE